MRKFNDILMAHNTLYLKTIHNLTHTYEILDRFIDLILS